MNKIKEILQNGPILLDGGMGTFLQKKGLPQGMGSDIWNLEKPDEVLNAHRDYVAAGTQIIFTNTFCGTPGTIEAGCELAKRAVEKNVAVGQRHRERPTGARRSREPGLLRFARNDEIADQLQNILIAGSLGPTENLTNENIELLFNCGVDLVVLETLIGPFSPLSPVGPFMVLLSPTQNGKLLSGDDPIELAQQFEAEGAVAVGLNCSFGPELLFPIFEKLKKTVKIPVAVKPSITPPESPSYIKRGKEEEMHHFAMWMKRYADAGADMIGGCCGTTPETIRLIKEKIRA